MVTLPRSSTARRSPTSKAAGSGSPWPAPICSTANGCDATGATSLRAVSFAPHTRCSPAWGLTHSLSARLANCARPARPSETEPRKLPETLLPRKPRSLAWRVKGSQTPKSPPVCFSARARSSTTWAKSSRSSGSRPARNWPARPGWQRPDHGREKSHSDAASDRGRMLGISRMLTGTPEAIVAHMNALSSIPTAPRMLPLVGHLVLLARDPLGLLESVPASSDLVRVRIGPAQAVLVCNPELTREVLIHDRIFDKGGPMYQRIREVIGDGLRTLQHGEHRSKRRLLQPAFHPARFPDYAGVMTTQISAVSDTWRDGQILDVLTETMTITSTTLAATLFADTLPPAALRQALDDLHTILSGIYRRMMTPPLLDRLPTSGNRRYHQAITRLRQTLGDVVSRRRASDIEIVDQALTFFAAGAETTAGTLAWALHMLGQHPDIYAQLQAEVDTVLAGRPATHADLPRLDLTKRVITETLRLWPPAWM